MPFLGRTARASRRSPRCWLASSDRPPAKSGSGGEKVELASPSEALKRGIAMVYQETSLVPSLTVAQNIYLTDAKRFHRLRGTYIAGQQFLQSLNFHVDPTALVSGLGAGQKQMVEIARAVHHNAQVIIFDEPTATLTPEEKHQFFSLVERLKARGVSIIFISHALEEALAIADRITVMRDGEHVVTDAASAFDREKIVRAMVGRTLTGELYGSHKNRRLRPAGEKVLSVQNLSMGNVVRNTSFSIFAGQITAVFGLIGSGRTEAAKVVAGVLKRNLFHGGQVRLEGRSVRYRVPRPSCARRHHLRHRGPQARRLLRDDVDRREHLCGGDRRRTGEIGHGQHERDA